MNENSLSLLGQLRLMETRGYSAYEVAQQNGFTGTEEEWLASLVGPQGEQGPEGKSAYQVAVENGYQGTEEEWVNDFLTPDGYAKKEEVNDLTDYNYYDEITYTKERYYNTDCYIVTIPMTDSEGNEIELYVGDGGSKTPSEYARDNYTTLTINASLYLGGSLGSGSVISNGEIIRDVDTTSCTYNAYCYLGIKQNRQLVEYQLNQTTAHDMLDDGCLQAWDVYYKILDNSVVLDMSNVVVGDSGVPTNKHPRQCLGQKQDGTIIILSCDGRTTINEGLTSEQTAQILLNKGCINAWNLDGGGSTSTIIKGSKINRNIDDNGTTERYIRFTLNAKKTITNNSIDKSFSKIGEEKQNIIQQIIPNINDIYEKFKTRFYTDLDLNTAIGETIVGYTNGFTPKPTSLYGAYDNSCYFININHPQDSNKNKYNLQFLMRRDYKEIYTRRQANGVWTDWTPVNARNISRFIAPIGNASSNVISANNTYQDIVFNDVISNNDFIKEDESTIIPNTTEFTDILVDSIGFVNLRVNGTIQCVSTGTKYFRIMFGNNDSTVISLSANSTGRYLFSLETLERITANTANTFKIQMYGSTGDYIQRCNVMVDIDR